MADGLYFQVERSKTNNKQLGLKLFVILKTSQEICCAIISVYLEIDAHNNSFNLLDDLLDKVIIVFKLLSKLFYQQDLWPQNLLRYWLDIALSYTGQILSEK